MEFIFFLLAGLIVLDLAVMRWGFDSRDSMDSAEWGRKRYIVW
jgi:hypothetical protein